MNTVATLSNDKQFTSFTYNGTKIRFAAPNCLEKYTKVLEWDNGYLVVLALYNGVETEEYIDLIPILRDLYIDPVAFLAPIRGVKIAYD